jgi:hypothetical protein
MRALHHAFGAVADLAPRGFGRQAEEGTLADGAFRRNGFDLAQAGAAELSRRA